MLDNESGFSRSEEVRSVATVFVNAVVRIATRRQLMSWDGFPRICQTQMFLLQMKYFFPNRFEDPPIFDSW